MHSINNPLLGHNHPSNLHHQPSFVLYMSPINNYTRYYNLRWKIDTRLTSTISDWSNGKQFDSPIFNDIFTIAIIPSEAKIGIKLLSLPNRLYDRCWIVGELQMQCNLKLEQIGFKFERSMVVTLKYQRPLYIFSG